MFSREFWQTFVQLLSFDGYMLLGQLHDISHIQLGCKYSQ
jgi:hypothetical protein